MQAILSYARAYTSRNCLLRLLTAGGDAEQYQGLVEELGRLGEELMLLLATDNNARLQAVQAGVAESLALLKQAAAYKVGSAASCAKRARLTCRFPGFIICRRLAACRNMKLAAHLPVFALPTRNLPVRARAYMRTGPRRGCTCAGGGVRRHRRGDGGRCQDGRRDAKDGLQRADDHRGGECSCCRDPWGSMRGAPAAGQQGGAV